MKTIINFGGIFSFLLFALLVTNINLTLAQNHRDPRDPKVTPSDLEILKNTGSDFYEKGKNRDTHLPPSDTDYLDDEKMEEIDPHVIAITPELMNSLRNYASKGGSSDPQFRNEIKTIQQILNTSKTTTLNIKSSIYAGVDFNFFTGVNFNLDYRNQNNFKGIGISAFYLPYDHQSYLHIGIQYSAPLFHGKQRRLLAVWDLGAGLEQRKVRLPFLVNRTIMDQDTYLQTGPKLFYLIGGKRRFVLEAGAVIYHVFNQNHTIDENNGWTFFIGTKVGLHH